MARKICELEGVDSYRTDGFVLEGVRFYRKKYNGKSIGLPKLLWRPGFFIFFLK